MKAYIILILLLFTESISAQSEAAPDFMRSTGKIYVVAAVTFIILITLFIYMISIDRKISRLEKRQKHE